MFSFTKFRTGEKTFYFFFSKCLQILILFTGLTASTFSQDYALHFNGTNQFVYTNLDAQPSALPTTTWEAWIRTSNISKGSWQTILSTDDGGYDRGIWIPGNNHILIGDGSGGGWLPAVTLNANMWYHIAVVFKPDNILFYLNGTEYSHGIAPTGQSTTVKFSIGATADGSGSFEGDIDEVRVWSIARSQTDILSTMNTELTGSENSLVAYYKMDEGSGTNTADNSSHGYTGTIYNSPTWTDGAMIPSGTGTSGDPYRIANINHLKWISDNSSVWGSGKYFSQTANVDASMTSNWNSSTGWQPIGNNSSFFRNSYDGQNYTISNLYISRSSSDIQGFFGQTDKSASIQNLRLTNVNITCRDFAGALVGRNNAQITSCYVSGTINGRSNVGGLTGDNNSTVTNCYSSVDINSTGQAAGGLVGMNEDYGNINSTYSTGVVSGSNMVGGLVGWDRGNLTNCYSFDTVNGNNDVGGLIAYIDGSYIEIDYCYSVGSVTGNNSVGGLIADNHSNVPINHCFWDKETSGISTAGAGTGKTSSEMKSYSTYVNSGWDFMGETTNGSNDYWGINETSAQNNGYPFLQWQGYSNLVRPQLTTQAVSSITSLTGTGNGTIASLGTTNPTVHGVCWSTSHNPTTADSKTVIAGEVTSTGAFTSAITGLNNSTPYYVRAYATNSIGTGYGDEVTFTTPFWDGDGTAGNPYTVSGLNNLVTISGSSSYWSKNYKQIANIDASATATMNGGQGFVPISPSGSNFTGSFDGNGFTIDNLQISRSGSVVQGLFGQIDQAKLQNIHLTNVHILGDRYVGALVGYAISSDLGTSSISGCSVTGIVTGTSFVGGLVGYSYEYTLNNCSSSCTVNGTMYVGGLAGQCGDTGYPGGQITNCSSSGTVTGTSDYVGGLVGHIYYGTLISNSSSSCNVSGVTYTGGLAGMCENQAKVSNCFSTGTVTGYYCVGGLVGENYQNSDITNCYSSRAGAVTGTNYVGGLIGMSNNSIITSSSSAGDVSGSEYIGGLAGYLNLNGRQISYNFSTGVVSGTQYTGGLVGSLDNSSSVSNCYSESSVIGVGSCNYIGGLVGYIPYGCVVYTSYSIGKVTGTGTNIGGLAGYLYSVSAYVDNSYWDTQTSTQSASAGGTARNTVDMKNTSSFSGFTFDSSNWVRDDSKNGGYPYLYWQTFPYTITITDGSAFSNTPTAGQTNQPIGCFALHTNSSGASLDAVWIKLNGTRKGASNFKLWESSDNTFNSGSNTQIGLTYTTDPGTGNNIWFTGLNKQLTTTDKYYFLTCDLASDATGSIEPVLVGNKDLMVGFGTLGTTVNNAPLNSAAVPLPVELSSFTAAQEKNAVKLEWQTATEVNNYGFEVERSALSGQLSANAAADSYKLNAESWTKIGFVKGSGNSNSPKSYSFTDVTPTSGNVQYRLKQIDNDGGIKYSSIITVNLLPTKFSLEQNYPNPFNPSTTIKFGLPSDSKVSLEVYNTIGQKVATLVNGQISAGYHQVEFNASMLASGIYFYRIHANGFVSVKKLLLLK